MNKSKILKYSLNTFGALLLCAGILIGDYIAKENEQWIVSYLFPPISTSTDNTKTKEEGEALSQLIVEEGSVLLKNNGVLPLSKSDDAQINIFGHDAADWRYGGRSANTSGMVQPDMLDWDLAVDLVKAFDIYEYDIEYNKKLIDMYRRYSPAVLDIRSVGTGDIMQQNFEPDIDDNKWYTEELKQYSKEFSNTAIVCIGRTSQEGADWSDNKVLGTPGGGQTKLNTLMIEFMEVEKKLISYVAENYENVIVVLNAANAMELTFLEQTENIDAILQVGLTGITGATKIPALLYGDSSPSGKTVDTYAYDLYGSNIANKVVKDRKTLVGGDSRAVADYLEGIYVGYKWYETADVEGIWDSIDNEFGKGYEGVVQYPFGFGLSYTTFDWELVNFQIKDKNGNVKDNNQITDDDSIVFDVKVTNTGEEAGKDVVEIYATVPYTPGGIEKSAVSLVGFGKTEILKRAESQTISIEVDMDDLLSYDCYDKDNNGFKGYELEKGDYIFSFRTDSHNKKLMVTSNGNKEVKDVVLNCVETINVEFDKHTGVRVANKFTANPDASKGEILTGPAMDGSDTDQDIPFITRENFPDPFTFVVPTRPGNDTLTKIAEDITKEQLLEWDNATTDIYGNPLNLPTEVKWGQKTGFKVANNGVITELGYELGANYDDPRWETLLSQMSVSEAYHALESIGSGTRKIDSIGKPHLADADGPAQIQAFKTGAIRRGTGFPCESVVAQTWNLEIAYKYGISYGKDMDTVGYSGTWGFGLNLHRSNYGGRNWEYYSEDTFLSSEFAVEMCRGLKNMGKYAFLKHYAMNDTEWRRSSISDWASEQTIREVYTKIFQKAIQEGGAMGLMTTYGRVGHQWSGLQQSLIQGLARDEWGFKGQIVTDASSSSYMCLDMAVRAGANTAFKNMTYPECWSETGSIRMQHRLQQAIKEVTFSWLNSMYTNKVYNETASDEEKWSSSTSMESFNWFNPVLIDINILVFAGAAWWMYLVWTDGKRKDRKDEPSKTN